MVMFSSELEEFRVDMFVMAVQLFHKYFVNNILLFVKLLSWQKHSCSQGGLGEEGLVGTTTPSGPSPTKIKFCFFHLKFYLSCFFRTQNSLIECIMRNLVMTNTRKDCLAKLLHHAGVAVKLGILKLKIIGHVYMLKDFIAIYTLAECTTDFVLSIHGKLCSDIIVHHAGVAVKVKCLVLFILNFYSLVSMAECSMMNFEYDVGLLKTSLIGKVMHHAGVAVKISLKQMKNKQVDNVMQKNKEVDKMVQNSNFFLVVGVLQLDFDSTQFDFCS
jgi:hypothetical protein